MDWAVMMKAVAALGVMGVGAGVLLATAAKAFHVEVDPRVEAVFGLLPGANCGACGRASCFAVAELMAEGHVEPNACVAGGPSVTEAVCGILGRDAETGVAVVSSRQCGGGNAVRTVYEYSGIASCKAAARLAGGTIACPAGCLGLGDCAVACPFEAMVMDGRGLPVIDPEKCTGCGICLVECPRGQSGLLKTLPDSVAIFVRCASHEKAKDKRSYCPVSCIGCKKCERECAYDAIRVEDNLAQVDYAECVGCGVCVSVCPQKCIDLAAGPRRVPPSMTEGKGPDVPGFAPTEQAGSAAGAEGETS